MTHYRLDYDRERTAGEACRCRLPQRCAYVFPDGVNLGGAKRAEAAAFYSRDDLVTAARDLAASCVPLDQGHFLQVTRLALRLFDRLRSLHGRGEDERALLQTAALLHDIGWADGQRGHHKNSMRRILREDSIPLDDRERKIVALVARYHRRALPKEEHPFFRTLDPGDRQIVRELACLLRIADGLDYSHDSSVIDVEVQVRDQAVRIFCLAHRFMGRDIVRAMGKGGKLFRTLFGRELMILWRHI